MERLIDHFQVVNLCIALHSIAAMYMLEFLENFHYIMCAGFDPQFFQKPLVPHRAIINSIALTLCLITNMVQIREKKELTRLQGTKTAGKLAIY